MNANAIDNASSRQQPHWTAIGRRLERETHGLPKREKTALMRREGERLGLAPHTLQRYIVLLSFLEENGVSQEDLESFVVGPLEVVMRITRLDAGAGMAALRGVRDGAISYRMTIAIEKDLKRNGTAPEKRLSPIVAGDLRQVAARLIADEQRGEGTSVDDLMEIRPMDDDRFAIVRVHRLFMAPGPRSVAVLDAANMRSGPSSTNFVSILRSAIIAAALFDHVLVRPGGLWDEQRFVELRRKSHRGSMDNIFVHLEP